MHYHTGTNMPGCLPEAEVGTHLQWEDARTDLLDQLSRGKDEISDPDARERAVSAAIVAARADLKALAEGAEFSANTTDLVYWIMPCDSAHCSDLDE